MKTMNDLIEVIEEHKVLINQNESKNDINKCKSIINDLILKIDSFIQNHISLPNEEIKALVALKNSFLMKSNNYSSYLKLTLKEQMIQRNLNEKYLANKKTKDNDNDDNNNSNYVESKISSKMIAKDFEVVTQDQVILIEIGKMCDGLIKGFEKQYNNENTNEDELVNKMKTMESFYVYDVQKKPSQQEDKMIIMKYLDTINEIKMKSELLKKTKCVTDIKVIKKLEEEIITIQDEINKTQSKNKNLVDRMKKNNIIPRSSGRDY